MPAAFGCVRFSSDKQEDGDSIRRQREKVLGWIDRNRGRLELDSTLGEGGFYTDRGMTGFATTGEERETLSEDYALGQLIRHAESGRIPAGSFLVVESADRLSRESAVHALHIITGLLKRKLVVVTLSPEAEYRADADLLKLFGLGITTERAHDESRIKSIRGRAVWEAKRATAADHPLTRIVPSWCKLVGARTVGGRLVGGEIREDRAKSEVVRRLFVLARSGLGTRSIANQLNEEGVPVVGRGKRWTETAVYHILTTPTVTGEFQPHTGRTGNSKKGRPETRKPAGAAVAGYYPAVVSREEFLTTQAVIKARAKFSGRRARHVNLFAGLLTDGRTGGTFTYRVASGRPVTLVPTHMRHDAPWTSFGAAVFDSAVLSQMAELKPGDILPASDLSGEVVRLGALHAAKEAELADFREQVESDTRLIRTFRDKIIALDREREELAGQLAAAQREAASPLAEAWGEFHGVAGMLERDGSDDLRRRCREALRRLVERVVCVFAGDRRLQFAAVQVRFAGGAHRDYLIVYEQKRAGGSGKGYSRPARWWVRSFADADLGDGLDLREPADAAAVARILDALEPAAFVPGPAVSA